MRVVIVGAGASGLAAGRRLAGAGHEVVVYEKSRGYGGRAATRRTHDCVFDHGAQYLKLPTDEPEVARLVLAELSRDGLVDIGRPVWTFDLHDVVSRGHERDVFEAKWTYTDGLNTLGKRLADIDGLTVVRETRVGRIERDHPTAPFGIYADDDTPLGQADQVLLATPAPQAIDVLRASQIGPTRRISALDALAKAPYRSMLSVMLGFAAPPEGAVFAGGRPDDPRPYYALVNTDHAHDISWLAVENDKGLSRTPEGTLAVIAQMAVSFSEAHYDDAQDLLESLVAPSVATLLGTPLGAPLWSDIARWRLAKPDKTIDLDEANARPEGLFLVGDYAAGWRLHKALGAGLAVAALMRDAATGPS